MMFLLRCAFCLSVVYAAILSSHRAPKWDVDTARTVAAVRAEASDVIGTAAGQASAFCARHAEECLADAARLTDLFHAAEPESAARELMVAGEREVPVPIPDPRRRSRGWEADAASLNR